MFRTNWKRTLSAYGPDWKNLNVLVLVDKINIMYDTIIMTALSFVTKIHTCHSICGLPACLQSWLVKPLLLFWEKGYQHKKKSAVWPAASQRYNHGQLFHQTSYYATMLENINYTLITQIEEQTRSQLPDCSIKLFL